MESPLEKSPRSTPSRRDVALYPLLYIALLFFVLLAALATILGITREDALRKLAPTQSYSKQDERR